MSIDFLKVEKPKNIREITSWSKVEQNGLFLFNQSIISSVFEIINDVKENGDKALLRYSRKFDEVKIEKTADFKVTPDEIKAAGINIPIKNPKLVEAINYSYKNIKKYHLVQLKNEPRNWFIKGSYKDKKRLGQLNIPIERVGIYIPGGRFIYPSSVLMTAIPAIIAGVKEIAVCTPPDKNNNISEVLLYIFSILNINEVYKIGGAHAIAALAFGTETVKKVDKIVGPGNVYVTTAKKLVYGIVGVDSLAGPSEVIIIADSKANPNYIAADILAQSEHDPDAKSMLLSTSESLAEEVVSKIYKQLKDFYNDNNEVLKKSKDIINKSLKNNCRVIYNPDIEFLIDICNFFAPEHLEIMVEDYDSVLPKIKNAGAIFLGNSTPAVVGDYVCGTNHVIPTSGNAKFSSPLGVYDFFKKTSVAYYHKKILKKEAKFIKIIADFENLYAHKNTIELRINDKE